MSTSWTRIPREEASSNPLYGVGGWLKLFVTLLILETGGAFYQMFVALRMQEVPLRAFLMEGDSWAVFPKLVLGVLLITTLMILAVLFSRAPVFRPMALTALVARGPLFAAAYLYTLRGADGFIFLAVLLGVWLIECLIWVTYLQRSRRVRLTYENTVKMSADTWSADSESLRYVGDGIATPLKRGKAGEPGNGPIVPGGTTTNTSTGSSGSSATGETGPNGRSEPSVFSSDPELDLDDDVPPLPPSLRRKQLAAEAASFAPVSPPANSPGTAPAASPNSPPTPLVPPAGQAITLPAAAAGTSFAAKAAAASVPPPSASSLVPISAAASPPTLTGAPAQFTGQFSANSPVAVGPQPGSATAARIAAALNPGAPTVAAAQVFPTLPDNAWEAALDEFEGPQRRRGLWARVFAQARGDEKRAQADYLLIRARELSQDRAFVESSSRPLI